MNLKIVYMGTPDFSVKPLDELNKKYDVIAVVTQPDKKIGRKQEVRYSKVKEYALENNIKVLQPKNIREEYQEIIDLNPDIIITCAYGQIIPKELLDYPKYKCINIHASLLPKYRGGAPIHRCIINGEKYTGITIMYMSPKMDEGDILYQEKIDISLDDNVGTLHDKLSKLGSKMIISFLPKLINNNFKRIKQDNNEATYAYNISREDEKIDFNKNTIDIYNQIRGLSPWPSAYAYLDDKIIKIFNSEIGKSNKEGKIGEIINIYDNGIGIKTIDGEIIFTEIQIEGKKRCNVKNFLNGIHDKNELLKKIVK